MAMIPRLWSINGLATELGMDRRAVAKRLRNVPPDGQLRGSPAWKLETAMCAMPRPARSAPPARTPHPDQEGGRHPADSVALIALNLMIATAPGAIAAHAVDRGAADANAKPLLERIALDALRSAAGDVLELIGAGQAAGALTANVLPATSR